MFGFIIFCVLCYLLYRFDLKHADYRMLKSTYSNDIIIYRLQRKLFNFFWFTREKCNRYNIEGEYNYAKERLDSRRKKKVDSEVITEVDREWPTKPNITGSTGTVDTSGSSSSSGTGLKI